MGFFGFAITDAFVLAVACAILYVIYNLVYHAAYTGKGIAVVSFIVNAIMLIALISSSKNIGDIYEFGEGFKTGTVGLMAAVGIGLAFALSAFFVSTNEGDDMGAGIGEAAGSTITLATVATIIQCFAKTLWPMYVLVIIGLLACIITWLRD